MAGRTLWVDAGEFDIAPLDVLVIRCGEGEEEAVAFTSPEQMIRTPPEVTGVVITVRKRRDMDGDCSDLPGAALPPLGSNIDIEGIHGAVVSLHAARGTVTVQRDDGSEVEVSVHGGHGGQTPASDDR